MVQDRTIQALSIRKNNNANNAVRGTDFYDFLSIKNACTLYLSFSLLLKNISSFYRPSGSIFSILSTEQLIDLTSPINLV